MINPQEWLSGITNFSNGNIFSVSCWKISPNILQTIGSNHTFSYLKPLHFLHYRSVKISTIILQTIAVLNHTFLYSFFIEPAISCSRSFDKHKQHYTFFTLFLTVLCVSLKTCGQKGITTFLYTDLKLRKIPEWF